jgi:hypothetical protein
VQPYTAAPDLIQDHHQMVFDQEQRGRHLLQKAALALYLHLFTAWLSRKVVLYAKGNGVMHGQEFQLAPSPDMIRCPEESQWEVH